MTQITFHYTAIGPRGARTRGAVRAGTQEEAYRQLAAAGMRPIRIRGRRARGSGRRITLRDLSQFTRQFSVLMQARIPIVDGLRSIVAQEPKERLRAVVEDVARQIEAGNTVTDSISPHRDVFGEVYIETVRAAETSGNMISVLDMLAEMLDRQYELTKDVKGALMYPICVVGALVTAVTFLMIFVIPRFESMFASRGIELPLPTRVVMGTSDFLRSYWYVLGAAIIGAFFAIRAAKRRPRARRRIDNALHHVPFLREVLRGLAISRFTRVLGIALRSGISLIDALDMAGRASGRPRLQVESEKLRDQVNTGGRLSDVIVTCQYFPSFCQRLIAAGEEAAELPRMCEIAAKNYDREVQHLTKNVTTVIEPILIAGLAGIVLVIALAIFLPMWNMAALLN
jgi:type II secretory pathway component PulF